MDDDSNLTYIDKRIIDICEQAEKNFIVSQSQCVNHYNQLILPTQTATTTNRESVNNVFPKLKLNTVNAPKELKYNTMRSIRPQKQQKQINSIVNKSIMSIKSLSSIPKNNNSLCLSNSSCFECEIRKLIADKQVYNAEFNSAFEVNSYLNSVLLQTKKLLSKNKPEVAYQILSNQIKEGVSHPDLFYLYGESCRLLKKMEESEKYLLHTLNFPNYSPYTLYSLGLLYYEVHQWKYSNIFFKKFIYFCSTDNASLRYLISKNYHMMQKEVKAINHINKAISLEQKSLFFMLRSEIYAAMGMEDESKKDIETAKYINNIK